MGNVVLFLSTGRSGTQWLARAIADSYGDGAEVTHEPLGPDYEPRRFLRAYDRTTQMLEIEAIRSHLAHVEDVMRSRDYVETGWPSYAAIPLFVARFPERVRLVRVIRHPVHAALSTVTHGFWSGRADGYATKAILDPWCEGIVQRDYIRRWPSMSPYEKCLFWWTELHLYADELHERFASVPFMDVRSEDLFDPATGALRELGAFVGVPDPEGLNAAIGTRVDEHRERTPNTFHWWEIFDHPNALAVAERHRYRVRWEDAADLRRRYAIPRPSWTKHLRSGVRWARARLRAATR